MPLPVPLSEVVDLVDAQGPENIAYLNRKTGELALLSDEMVGAAERGDAATEHPEWMHAPIAVAAAVLKAPDDWLGVPSSDGMPDKKWMARFAAQRNEKLRAELDSALCGPHPFRRFRQVAAELGLLHAWLDYRQERVAQEIADWLEAEGIPFDPNR
jgi:hypothetical protein